MLKFTRLLFVCVIGAAMFTSSMTHAQAAELDSSTGQAIYRQGLLSNGRPLTGSRLAANPIQGAEAACINCHRRSGLGSTEGFIQIPPITGDYLFRSTEQTQEDLNAPHPPQRLLARRAYTEESLARALREGIAPDGRKLNYVMPRFELDDASLTSLAAYLRSLSKVATPGVTSDTLHFATIITPDADPAKRKAMLDVMNRFFADKNEFLRGGTRKLYSAREIGYRVTRQWRLHVWELSGPSSTWREQLERYAAQQPVFAAVSGIGRKWDVVHRFCVESQLPCLLPNTDAPPTTADSDYYNIYFSRGVNLESALMAQHMRQPVAQPGGRVIQVWREGDIGEDAAKNLAAIYKSYDEHGEQVVNRGLRADARVEDALKDVSASDTLLLWLRPADIARLPDAAPAAKAVYMSGLMAGLETAPLNVAWKSRVLMSYPVDPPDLRRLRMNYPLSWLRIKGIALTDERLQADTYIACNVLAELVGEMLDSFVRDYLLERAEDMMGHRVLNAYYPRLSLAPGQRFASKGGYLVQFADGATPRIQTVTGWLTP